MNFCAGILNAAPQEGPEQVGLLIQLLELLAYVGIIMFELVAVLLMISPRATSNIRGLALRPSLLAATS